MMNESLTKRKSWSLIKDMTGSRKRQRKNTNMSRRANISKKDSIVISVWSQARYARGDAVGGRGRANISKKDSIVISVWSQANRTMSYSCRIRQWPQRTTKRRGTEGILKGRPLRSWDFAAQKVLPVSVKACP